MQNESINRTNRTKSDFLYHAAKLSVNLYEESETQFVSQWKPEFKELARDAYRRVKGE